MCRPPGSCQNFACFRWRYSRRYNSVVRLISSNLYPSHQKRNQETPQSDIYGHFFPDDVKTRGIFSHEYFVVFLTAFLLPTSLEYTLNLNMTGWKKLHVIQDNQVRSLNRVRTSLTIVTLSVLHLSYVEIYRTFCH